MRKPHLPLLLLIAVLSQATALAADRNDGWAKRRYLVPASPTVNVKNVLRRKHAA